MAAYEVLMVAAGIVIGWIRRGSLWAITSLQMRHLWLLPVAYLLQHISISMLTGVAYETSIVLSYIGLIIFCVVNLRIPGVVWALWGTVSNFVVMAVNGLRMPAYLPIIQAENPKLVPLLEAGKIGKSIAMTSHTHLNFLGDIFPFRVWPQSMISIGDIVFGIGFTILVQHAMTLDKGGGVKRAESKTNETARSE